MNSNQLQRKNIRGKYDSSATPSEIYNIVLKLGYTDVCNSVTDNALTKDWPEKAFCNPPYSAKAPFIRKAVEENKKGRRGKKILLYLPLDPTTRWFQLLYENNVAVLILMKRFQNNRWPTALYYLNNFWRSDVVFAKIELLEAILND